MKKVNINTVYGLLVLFWISNIMSIQAQEIAPESSSVASMVQFEEYPIDYYTGMPNVSIPLFKLPTHSKDIGIDLRLNYHPASVAAYDSITGNCGRGWNLFNGGTISRQLRGKPDEFEWTASGSNIFKDAWFFNFMGFSGKFVVNKNTNGTLEATISENKGRLLHIDLEYNATTYTISSFTVYDDKGYKYVFSDTDEFIYVTNIGTPSAPVEKRQACKTAYHLSGVYDNNNMWLLNFGYTARNKVETYHQGTEKNTIKEMRTITSTDFGSIEYFTNSMVYNQIRYGMVLVKDVFGIPVRRFDFTFNGHNLTKVEESDFNRTKIIKHEMLYKSTITNNYSVKGVDAWGYHNNLSEWCTDPVVSSMADPAYITTGVLQKMILPSGGCIIYEYESNTFSYQNGVAIENPTAPDSFTVSTNPRNKHNFTFQEVGYHNFTPSPTSELNFTLTSPSTLYFRFDLDPIPVQLVPGGPISYVNPKFTLYKNGSSIKTFQFLDDYGNGQNLCMGSNMDLTAGTYSIKMSHLGTAYATVSKRVTNANVKKWWYGGGIRIKKIGHFQDGTVTQNYYSLANPTILPERESSYDYSLFDQPDKSSGSIVSELGVKYTSVKYKNVTVTSTTSEGKTTYDLISPIDFPQPGNSFKFGRLKEAKSYNPSGQPVKSTAYLYGYTDIGVVDSFPELQSVFNLGWAAPVQITEKVYQPGGTAIETVSNFIYENNRKIRTQYETTIGSSEVLSTKYFYSTGNSPYSKNRITDVERVESYNNDVPLFTKKINYSNVWVDVDNSILNQGLPNQSYLPVSVEGKKSDKSSVVQSRVNLYNIYSQPVEIQQENGNKACYIWGYHDTLPIAIIENVSYSSLNTGLISAAKSASNLQNENNLLTALSNLRNSLPDANVTTYTHKPLIGVSTVTDAKGYKVSYEYDVLNMLKTVKDTEGRILSENEYHYKTQN